MKSIFASMLCVVSMPAWAWQVKTLSLSWPDRAAQATKPGVRVEGGHSGLFCEEKSKEELHCFVVTDRGPNGGKKNGRRPFLNAKFQPRIIEWKVSRTTGKATYVRDLPLVDAKKNPLTGLPNLEGVDETPVDFSNQPFAFDPRGLDLEGIAKDDQGYWMVEEYGPSIVRFNTKGVEQGRWIPKSETAREGTQALSPELSARNHNFGFEGVTFANGLVYAVMQSPLPRSIWVRVVAFDPKKNTEIAQYLLPFDGTKADRVGDLTTRDGQWFYWIEHDGKTDPKGTKKIFRGKIEEATNLDALNPSVHVETLGKTDLQKKGIRWVEKEEVVDLLALGLSWVEKFEGLSVLSDGSLILVNDNDFGLKDDATPDPGKVSNLFILTP